MEIAKEQAEKREDQGKVERWESKKRLVSRRQGVTLVRGSMEVK